MSSKPPIIMISGSKGGVGKSIVSMTALDLLGSAATLVETDTSNPDVAKAYAKTNETHALDLDDRSGWIDLINLADATDGPLLINGAARSIDGLKNAPILGNALKELGRELLVLFVMSRARDSVELLADHRDVLPASVARTWPVLNGYFGSPEKFTRYQDSDLRKKIEAQTGTLVFPDLADRVLDQLNDERLTIAEAVHVMQIGNRMELLRWRDIAKGELEKAIG